MLPILLNPKPSDLTPDGAAYLTVVSHHRPALPICRLKEL